MATVEVINNIPEGFPTYGANVISYVSEDGTKLYLNQPYLRIMVLNEDGLADLPSDLPIGSEAFLADESQKWRLGADGQWAEIGAASSDVTPSDDDPPADNTPPVE